MPITYIIGHQKPDTDSAVAVLALEYLFKHQSSFGYANPHAVLADPINPETEYLLKRFQITAPPVITAQDIQPNDQVVLVDHNEESQRLKGINPQQIVEIIDHHKVNLNFSEPIYLNSKPWGSTTSIIYYMMQRFTSHPIQPNPKLAGLMLAAILSDTVGFKSSTTTKRDQDMAQELAKIAQIEDLNGFALDIFKAKSNLDSLTSEELVKNDYKIFEFAQKVFIGQLETVEQAQLIQEKKSELLAAMQIIKQQEQVDLIYLAISDILQTNTKLLILGDEEAQVAVTAFGGEVKENVLDIGPKLSRKKDIAPQIDHTLTT